MYKRIGYIIAILFCALNLSAQTYHGTRVHTWHNDIPISMYLPEDYFTSIQYYPVLYLLHGTGENEESWFKSGNAEQIFDQLIGNGNMRKMIVVMPYSSGETDGAYENSFRDLMSFVERNFRTLKGKRFHAIAGLSLGGFYAMHISHRYYNKFDYVGLFSAIYTTDKKSIFKKERDALFGITQTSPIIYKNTERDLERQFKLNPKLYFIAIGKRDFLYNQNVLFRDYLTEKEYPFVYHETGGGHEWKNWQAYLMTFLPLLFNDLPNEIDASYEELEEDVNNDIIGRY